MFDGRLEGRKGSETYAGWQAKHRVRYRHRGHLSVASTCAVVALLCSACNLNWSGYLFGAAHTSDNAAATAITTGNASMRQVGVDTTRDPVSSFYDGHGHPFLP
jgi:putative intracellular protease/amidase